MTPTIETRDIKALLRKRYKDHRRYAIAEETGTATGGWCRHLDMVVVDCYASNHFAIHGIEVKASKADFRREFDDNTKHNVFYPNLDYFSIAAPADCIDLDLVPPKWGVYVVKANKDGELILRRTRKPKDLHDEPLEKLDKPFVASLVRAMACQSPTAAQLSEAREEARKQEHERYKQNEGATLERLRKENEELRQIIGYARRFSEESAEDGLRIWKQLDQINVRSLISNMDWLQKDLERQKTALQELFDMKGEPK